MPQTSPIIISIGANLPGLDGRDVRSTCSDAAESLRSIAGLRMAGLSRWYQTAPIPIGGPLYVNGVAWLEGNIDPTELLGRLQYIENRAGRVRTGINAPRILDLDIVAMGDLLRDGPDPILPHPRAHLRRFVLQPLVELIHGWVHPRLHCSAAFLLENLPDQGVNLL